MQSSGKLSFIIFILFLGCLSANAQTGNAGSGDMIKQGAELNNQHKYAEAIDKFNQALKADPDNAYANYEMAFSLYSSKKQNDAIPYLQKVVKLNSSSSLTVTAYILLASIYDQANQAQKAIETYNLAITIDPNYPQIYFNLGLAYFRNKQYTEAENSAIEAIKHNPKDPASQRLYALVTFHQNKRLNAFLGFCSFLLLEPTGPRATEAYANMQHILQGGVLADAKGGNLSPQAYKQIIADNQAIAKIVKLGQGQKLTGASLLQFELKGIFNLAGQLSNGKPDKGFFDDYLAAYFYKLAQSDNMPAFTNTIVLANKPDGAKWAANNTAQVAALKSWLSATDRTF